MLEVKVLPDPVLGCLFFYEDGACPAQCKHFNPLTTANMNVVANLTKQYKNDIVSYRQLLSFSRTQEH